MKELVVSPDPVCILCSHELYGLECYEILEYRHDESDTCKSIDCQRFCNHKEQHAYVCDDCKTEFVNLYPDLELGKKTIFFRGSNLVNITTYRITNTEKYLGSNIDKLE